MIDINKKYKTRIGALAVIYKIYEKYNKAHGAILHSDGEPIIVSVWDLQGNVSTEENGNDLIEISPYEDFKIDDKVLVWNYDPIKESLKTNRYFAGIDEEGLPMVWVNGATSWSAKAKETWYKCEKYEETK